MSYIFNRITLIIVAGIIFILVMSVNEAVNLGQKMRASNRAAIERWQTLHATVFPDQYPCQVATGYVCEYRSCDTDPEETSTPEVCLTDFNEGWYASGISLTEHLKNPRQISLTIESISRTDTYLINTADMKMLHTGTTTIPLTPQEVDLPDYEVARVIGKMAIYDVIHTPTTLSQPTADNPVYYLRISNASGELMRRCRADQCSAGLREISRDISRLTELVSPNR